MATVKFPSEMPSAADVGGNDKLMISKDGSGEAFQVSFNDVKQYLEITDIELDPVQGGSSSGSATVIPNGPSGQNRKMDASPGWYSVGGVPVEATSGHVWKWFWNGTTWSLVDVGELPDSSAKAKDWAAGTYYSEQTAVKDGVLYRVKKNVASTTGEPGVSEDWESIGKNIEVADDFGSSTSEAATQRLVTTLRDRIDSVEGDIPDVADDFGSSTSEAATQRLVTTLRDRIDSVEGDLPDITIKLDKGGYSGTAQDLQSNIELKESLSNKENVLSNSMTKYPTSFAANQAISGLMSDVKFGGVIPNGYNLAGISQKIYYFATEGSYTIQGGTITTTAPLSIISFDGVNWTMSPLSYAIDPTDTTVRDVQHEGLTTKLEDARNRVVRLLAAGTSLANGASSFWRGWAENAKRHFGDSGNTTRALGVMGGSWSDPYRGWIKERASVFATTRLIGIPSSLSFDIDTYAKRVTLRYSIEADGSSFDINVDGIYHSTVDCSGAQRYGNELTIHFDNNDLKTITFNPPTSGRVYLESLDECIDNPGLHVMDGTLGGSSLGNFLGQYTTTWPVQAIGDNGIDGFFRNDGIYTKPDIILCTYLVNDAGGSISISDFQQTLDKIHQFCLDNDIQLIYVVEMAGHYGVKSLGLSKYNKYQSLKECIYTLRGRPNATVIDWNKKIGFDTDNPFYLQFIADTYYYADVNIVDGTHSGDFIHPNNKGNRVATDMLNKASGMPSIGHYGTRGYNTAAHNRHNPYRDNNFYAPYADGETEISMEGRDVVYINEKPHYKVGAVLMTPHTLNIKQPLYYCPEIEHEEHPSFTKDLLTDRDKYGYYKLVQASPGNPSINIDLTSRYNTLETFTVMIFAGNLKGLTINAPSGVPDTVILCNGKEIKIEAGKTIPIAPTIPDYDVTPDQPVAFAFTVKAASEVASNFSFNMPVGVKVYGMFITYNDYAVFGKLPVRDLPLIYDYRDKLPISGLNPFTKYTGLGDSVKKYTGQSALCLLGENKGENVPIFELVKPPTEGLTLTSQRESVFMSHEQYGDIYQSSGSARTRITGLRNIDPLLKQGVFTILGFGYGNIRVFVFNGGNNNYKYLQPDGTWSSLSTVIANIGGLTPILFSITFSDIPTDDNYYELFVPNEVYRTPAPSNTPYSARFSLTSGYEPCV